MELDSLHNVPKELREGKNAISFSVGESYFLYERLSNTIHIGSSNEISSVFKKVESIGYSPIFEGDSLKKRKDKSIDGIIFNVTESCNLSCKYCIYSGAYIGERENNNLNMSEETANTAIKNILPNLRDKVFISFYGGEPTNNFGLMKKIMNSVRSKNPKKQKVFTFSTNFVDVENYLDDLIRDDVYITISLDGPKEVHDKNRLDSMGYGSFYRIMHNLDLIKMKDSSFQREHISLSGTYGDSEDFAKIMNYFIDHDQDFLNFRLGVVYTKGLKNSESGLLKPGEIFQFAKLYSENLINGNANPKILKNLFDLKIKSLVQRDFRQTPEKLQLNGSCYPGKRKLFIDTSGGLYPCEKIGGRLPIGNVHEGFNEGGIEKIINDFVDIRNETCNTCWAARLCQPCIVSAKDSVGDISKKGLKESCKSLKSNIVLALSIYNGLIKSDSDRQYLNYYNTL